MQQVKRGLDRRSFLGAAGGSLAAAVYVRESSGQEDRLANARPQVAVLGAGWRPDIKRVGRGVAIGRQAAKYSDVVALAEVDSVAAEYANAKVCGGEAQVYEDYRDLLERSDIDAVIVGAPDHWHAKMSIDAMRAGKDVYCEKPATVTVAEGRQMSDVVAETGRVLQVGTQQRTDNHRTFAKAIAIVRSGRLGRVHTIRVGVDEGLQGGPFKKTAPPKHFSWDLWQGPAAERDYIAERTHWTFRWWVEYAGGKLTDWGAHHVDIAQWAIQKLDSGPTTVSGTGSFLQPLENGRPTRDDVYSTPTTFNVTCRFEDVPEYGSVEVVLHSGDNGILIIGDEGRIFVNRGRLSGRPIEELANNPLSEDAIDAVYRELPWGGPRVERHMSHFFDSVKSRQTPVSDMETHHRSITTCHIANLALRLGRPLQWDAAKERFVDDAAADAFLKREYREGYEIKS